MERKSGKKKKKDAFQFEILSFCRFNRQKQSNRLKINELCNEWGGHMRRYLSALAQVKYIKTACLL